MAQPTFRQFIKDTHQRTRLQRPGRRLVRFYNVTRALLNVAAEQDDLVPLPSATVLRGWVGSQGTELLIVKGIGHVLYARHDGWKLGAPPASGPGLQLYRARRRRALPGIFTGIAHGLAHATNEEHEFANG